MSVPGILVDHRLIADGDELALLPTEVTLQICPVCPAPVVEQAHSFPAVLATAAGKMGQVDPLLDYFPAD